jgi:hypothetical protein
MIVACAGRCGRKLLVPRAGSIYLCAGCWKGLFAVLFTLVRRGTEVFTVRVPRDEDLS